MLLSRRALTALITLISAPWAAWGQYTFDTDFECGNGTAFTQTGPGQVSFEVEPDTNSDDRQWFEFAIEGAKGETVTFQLNGTDTHNVKGHWGKALPVASSDGGEKWRFVTGPTSATSSTFTFTHEVAADPERIAFHFPYTVTRANEKIAEWAAHPAVTRTQIGASNEGRPIEWLRIEEETPAGSGTNGSPRRGFWLVARQHAAEVTGSWLLEGFMDFLLSDDPDAVALRRGATINVVPMMNPDGVTAGNYRDNARGVNLNRVWNDAQGGGSPEVAAALAAIDAWVADGKPYDFFADLHSTSGTHPHFGFYANASIEPPLYPTPAKYHADSVRFLKLMEAAAPGLDPGEGESGSTSRQLARQEQMYRHGVLAFTFEAGYNLVEHGPDAAERMTPQRHREVGVGLARALRSYFDLPLPE